MKPFGTTAQQNATSSTITSCCNSTTCTSTTMMMDVSGEEDKNRNLSFQGGESLLSCLQDETSSKTEHLSSILTNNEMTSGVQNHNSHSIKTTSQSGECQMMDGTGFFIQLDQQQQQTVMEASTQTMQQQPI